MNVWLIIKGKLAIVTGPHRVIRLKGEVSREFDVISKAKNVCLSTETKQINCLAL